VTTLVIGGGFSGIAAAWALSQRGREVRLVWEGPGASSLYPGVLDRVDWTGPPDPRPLVSDAEGFLGALGCFAPSGGVGARVATGAGMLRPARVRDRAVLDLEPLRGRRIGVVDFDRPGWDAAALARAFSESTWARHSRTEFQPLRVAAPHLDALHGLPPLELAARADDPAWLAELAPGLATAGDGQSPLLLGPWLGLSPGTVERWRELIRRPMGETLSDPGGAAGARYEAARDAWLVRAGLRVEQGHVRSVTPRGRHFEVMIQRDLEAPPTLLTDDVSEVILAIGGVTGGGIRFLSGLGPEGRTFSLSLDAPVALRLAGREVALHSGALGADLQLLGVESLLEVGLSVDEQMVARAPALYAVGDVVANRPRQALEAIYSALGAARAVCRVRAPSLSP
jgi:glycerol-3-phosphate dehydrogenase subunit B